MVAEDYDRQGPIEKAIRRRARKQYLQAVKSLDGRSLI